MRISVYERHAAPSPLQAPNVPALAPESDGGANIAGIVKNLSDRAIKLQNDYDDARTLELFNKFKHDSSDYHDNPDSGIYHTRTGYLSQGVFLEADQWLRKRGEDYARQLHSPRAKNNFRRMAGDFISQQGQANSRFEATQMKKYRVDSADAAINNYLADIEAHWNEPDYIARARDSINQALELKFRGEGSEVLFHEAMNIDDKIAQARLRQAYLKDPLLAVRMLHDKDIKLKPDTRAQITETLRKNTEIYELSAIAQLYSQNFSLENANDAFNSLIKTYGAEKGQKAFNALYRLWSINHSQEAAIRQRKAREQSEADEAIAWRFLRGDDISEQEVLNNHSISPNTAAAIIRGLKTRKAEQDRLLADQKKLQSKKLQNELEILSWAGTWADDNFLQGFIKNGDLTDDEARAYRNRREKFYEDKRKSTLNETADNLTRKLIDPDKYGRLSLQDIQDNLTNLDPDKARVLQDAVKARDKSEAAQEAQNKQEARKLFQSSLRIIAENGGLINREQVNILLQAGKIDDAFASYLYRKNDDFERNQASLLKQSQKDAQEQAKLQRKENLYSKAQEFSRTYPLGHEGNGRAYIQSLDIPVDDKLLLLQYYDYFIHSQSLQGKNSSDEQQEIIDLEIAKIMTGEGKNRDFYFKLFDEGSITKKQLDAILAEVDKRDKARAKVQNDDMKNRAFQYANNLFNQFGIDNIEQAYEQIRNIPDRQEQTQTMDFFNRRVNEERSSRNEQNRLRAETQRKNYIDLDNSYWRNFKTVPPDILDNLRDNQGLDEAQYQRALSINAKLGIREGVIEQLLKAHPDFHSWTLQKQEAEIMSRLGTDENSRRQNIADLLELLQNGQLTKAQTDFYFYHGYISSEDRENINNFDKRFEREQRAAVHATEASILKFVNDLGVINTDLRQELIRNARVDFMLATNNLDVKDKDFNARLQDIYNRQIENIASIYASRVSLDGWFSRTPAGRRYDNAMQSASGFSVPQSEVQIPYSLPNGSRSYLDARGNIPVSEQTLFQQDNLPHDPYYQPVSQDVSLDIPPEFYQPFYPQPRVRHNTAPSQHAQDVTSRDITSQDIATEPGFVDFTQGLLPDVPYKITDSYYAEGKAYRQGRSHLAIDLRAPEGSNLILPGNGLQWSVSKGYNNIAGNFIKATTTTHNGDSLVLTFAHLSTADINNGDILSSGQVIGKSGSTGNTTGPCLHISAKLNGKNIDPRKINFGVPAAQSQLATPIVSSDALQLEALNAILFGGFNSQDLLSPYNFGVNY